jgi:hypothetical protein
MPDPTDPEQRLPGNYGVVARLEGGVLQLELTFRSGVHYCCFEHGCHHFMTASRRWDLLRADLARQDLPLPSRLELRIEVIIEEGALFFDWRQPDPHRRGWYGFAPEEAGRYRDTVLEAPELK